MGCKKHRCFGQGQVTASRRSQAFRIVPADSKLRAEICRPAPLTGSSTGCLFPPPISNPAAKGVQRITQIENELPYYFVFYFKKFYCYLFLLLLKCVLHACARRLCMVCVHEWRCLQSPEDVSGCWDLNLSSLQEQHTHLIAESS